MFNIAQYLEKFKCIGESEQGLRRALALVISEVVGVSVDIKNIIIKNGEAIIKVSPLVKNSIYIKKEKILKELRKKIEGKIQEIR